MKRVALLSLSVVFAAALFTGAASADPLKNYRLLVPDVSCEGSDEKFTFVINGEGIAGHIIGETRNIMPVQDTVTYTPYVDPATGEVLATKTIEDELGQFSKDSNKTGLKKRGLEECTGTTEYVDPETGLLIKVEFEIQAFFTPRGK